MLVIRSFKRPSQSLPPPRVTAAHIDSITQRANVLQRLPFTFLTSPLPSRAGSDMCTQRYNVALSYGIPFPKLRTIGSSHTNQRSQFLKPQLQPRPYLLWS